MSERCNFCGHSQAVPLLRTTRNLWGCEECLAEVARCCECSIVIEQAGGKTWEDGLAYCHECAQDVPGCFCCGRPAFEVAAQDDNGTICLYCEGNFPRCNSCDALVYSDCLTYGEKSYCQACAERYPLCLDCGEAVQHGQECSRCGGPVRACGGCCRLLSLRWHICDGWWYCPECFWEAMCLCQFCLEPALDGICEECAQDRVSDPDELSNLLNEVRWFCDEELGLRVTQPFQLKVASRPQDMPRKGSDTYVLGRSVVGLWDPGSRQIWIGQGYPVWFAAAVLAHEFTHVWQWQHCPRQSPDLMEGFASWVEWRVAHNLGREAFAENLLRTLCPVYGRGLRRCLRLEQQLGPTALVERMKTLTSFSLWTSMLALFD